MSSSPVPEPAKRSTSVAGGERLDGAGTTIWDWSGLETSGASENAEINGKTQTVITPNHFVFFINFLDFLSFYR